MASKETDGALELLWELYRRSLDDPVFWAEQVLGVELWKRQKEILRSVFTHRRTVVPAGHGVGKTFVSAVATLAFLYLRKPSKVITTAPTWTQVERLLWSEINSLFKLKLAPQRYPGKALQTQLRVRDDWFALGISSAEKVRFQGFHQKHILIILDEAPGVRRQIYEGADSLMSAGDAHMLMIGNPTQRQGHFYDACRKEGWNVLRTSCEDSPNFTGEAVSEGLRRRLVTREWVEEKAREWGVDSPQYQSKVLGHFPAADDDQLISLRWVEEAVERHRAASPAPGFPERIGRGDSFPRQARDRRCLTLGMTGFPRQPARLGVDVARFGADATVYTVLVGNRVEEILTERRRDTMQIAGRVVRLKEAYAAEAIGVDDMGVGGGVVDRLRELGLDATPINVAESAIERDRFANRRAELWWNMREWVRDEGRLPRHPKLIEDLTAAKFSFESRGRIKLESKDDIRRRLGRSPDYGDSLMLALAAEAAPSLSAFGDGRLLTPIARDFPT